MHRNLFITMCLVAILMLGITGCNKEEIANLNERHISDSTVNVALQNDIANCESRAAEAQIAINNAVVLADSLNRLADKLMKENSRLTKKLAAKEAKIDSLTKSLAEKTQWVEAQILALNTTINELELKLEKSQRSNHDLENQIAGLKAQLEIMTEWRDYYKKMASRTILQKIFGSGKAKKPASQEPV